MKFSDDAGDDEWSNIQKWNSVCPHLRISDHGVVEMPDERKTPRLPPTATTLDTESVKKLGFVEIDSKVGSEKLREDLKLGIQLLHEKGFPCCCIMLYDEVWRLAAESYQYFDQCGLEPTYDILAWYIDGENAGFSPHRDRQPENAENSFDSSTGMPKLVTHWISLSEATSSTSCLYFIPKSIDPGYIDGDIEEKDPLARAFSSKEMFQYTHACHRNPGQSVLFSHRVIHWGSARLNPKAPPRVAISFVASDPMYEKPYLAITNHWPNFQQRLLLVRAQILIYHERIPNLSTETILSCFLYCKKFSQQLDETYRNKVFYEFVQAMKKVGAEDNEEVMEVILDLEEKGVGDIEFNDDFSDNSISCGVVERQDTTSGSEDEEFKGCSLFGQAKRQRTD